MIYAHRVSIRDNFEIYENHENHAQSVCFQTKQPILWIDFDGKILSHDLQKNELQQIKTYFKERLVGARERLKRLEEIMRPGANRLFECTNMVKELEKLVTALEKAQ